MMKSALLSLFTLGFLSLGVSCGGIDLPDENEVESKKQLSLSVTTRTVSGETLNYPITVVAFNHDGRGVAQQTISSAETALNLSLPAGTYRLVAMSGTEGCVASSSNTPSLNDFLALPEDHAAEQPLMRGEASVTLTTGKAKVSVLMAHVMTNVKVELTDVPQDVTAVSVRLHPVYTRLSWGNQYAEPNGVTLVCQKTETGTWTTKPQYVFPSSEGRTILTLEMTTATEARHYGYTLAMPLKAATPYLLRGRFSPDGGIGIGGEILSAGWNATVHQDFEFGPSSGIPIEHGDTPTEPPTGGVVAGDFPKAGTIWNGHAVAYVLPISEKEVQLMLLSLNEWYGLASALSLTSPDEAQEIATSYTEGGLSDWQIPNQNEARFLSDSYHDEQLTTFNQVIESAGGTPLLAKENDKNVRYLCEEARYTYDYRGGSILAAGKTVKTYRLRLVKWVSVKKQ